MIAQAAAATFCSACHMHEMLRQVVVQLQEHSLMYIYMLLLLLTATAMIVGVGLAQYMQSTLGIGEVNIIPFGA
jgi:hypothetical protein